MTSLSPSPGFPLTSVASLYIYIVLSHIIFPSSASRIQMILGLHPWPLPHLTPVTILGSPYLVYGFRYAYCTKIPKTSNWEPDPYFQIPTGNLGVTKISGSTLKAYHLLENVILILCSLSQLAKPETWISEMRELPLPPPQHPTSSTYILHRSYSAFSFQPE